MRALALDLGSKRIGIALSSGTLATPYEVLVRAGDRRRDHRAIAEHVAETEAEVVVVGGGKDPEGLDEALDLVRAAAGIA